MFSVRGKSGKILAEAIVGMAEFRTDHGLPIAKKVVNDSFQGFDPRTIEFLQRKIDFISHDPWEIPPPVFCPPASEIEVVS